MARPARKSTADALTKAAIDKAPPLGDSDAMRTFARENYIANRGTSRELIGDRAARFSSNDNDILHLQKLIDDDKEIGEIKHSEYYERCKKKLTRRQEMFLDELLKGNTLVSAYRHSYNVRRTRSHAAVFSDAWKLAQHPLIVLEMRAVASQKHQLRTKSAHEIREYVIERLLGESQHAHESGSRIRALELLGKIAEVGMFVTRHETTVKRDDPEELKRLLTEKLRTFFRLNSGHDDVEVIEDKNRKHVLNNTSVMCTPVHSAIEGQDTSDSEAGEKTAEGDAAT